MSSEYEKENPYQTPDAVTPDLRLESQDSLPDEFKPFQTIWFHPRRTIRQLIATNPNYHVYTLVCIEGIGQSLDRASGNNSGDTISMLAILMIALVFGPIGGLFSLFFGSVLIRWAGKLQGGQATFQEIRTAMAWGAVPAVVSILIWGPDLLLFGSEMFTELTPRMDAQPSLWTIFFAFRAVEISLGVWSLFLICNTLAEVQGFRSAWRGFFNLILAGMIVLVPIILVAFVLLSMMPFAA